MALVSDLEWILEATVIELVKQSPRVLAVDKYGENKENCTAVLLRSPLQKHYLVVFLNVGPHLRFLLPSAMKCLDCPLTM